MHRSNNKPDNTEIDVENNDLSRVKIPSCDKIEPVTS